MVEKPSTESPDAEGLAQAKNAFQEIDTAGKPVEPAKSEEKAPEPTPQPEAPKPEEKPAPTEAKEEPKDAAPQRPERYIPIPQYQDEKKQWQEKVSTLEAELAKLRTAQENAGTPSEVRAANDKIKAWAEKHGMDVEAAQGLIEIAREGMGIPKESLAAIQAVVEAQRREQESQARFTSEFDKDVTPLIRAEYPEATEAQIAAAKKVMDELAHTKELAQTPLRYIFHGNKADFAELFTDKPGVERSKSANTAAIKGSHFKGKKDFSAVLSLPDDERARVESEMDPQTAWAYYDYVEKHENKLEINRQGRTITLQ